VFLERISDLFDSRHPVVRPFPTPHTVPMTMSRVRHVPIEVAPSEDTPSPSKGAAIKDEERKTWIDGIGFWLLVAFFVATIACALWSVLPMLIGVALFGWPSW
jgi:hypothetical protein